MNKFSVHTVILSHGVTRLRYGQDDGYSFIFAGTAPSSAPTLQFLGRGRVADGNTVGTLVVKGAPGSVSKPAYGGILQESNTHVIDSGGFQISDGRLVDSMACRTALTVDQTGTIANGGTLIVSSDGQATFREFGTITLDALGSNILNLSSVHVAGPGVIVQQGENDVTYVSSVTGTDFQITGGALKLANPAEFNGTIGPISDQTGAPAMGIFGEVDVFNAQQVTQASFDTSTGFLSLLNSMGGDAGNIHFAGVAKGLRLSQEPGMNGGSPFLALNDQEIGASGNVPLVFHP